MIDRECADIEALTPEEEQARALKFKQRERERNRRRSPGTPKRSASEVTQMRHFIKLEKEYSVKQEMHDFTAEDVAQSKSHPSLPERKSPEVPRRSMSQPAIGSRIVTKKIRIEVCICDVQIVPFSLTNYTRLYLNGL
jgi:hypothetical protein